MALWRKTTSLIMCAPSPTLYAATAQWRNGDGGDERMKLALPSTSSVDTASSYRQRQSDPSPQRYRRHRRQPSTDYGTIGRR